MTDTWAAKVLEGVPHHYDANCDRVILKADAIAAIAKLTEGNGLVERATAALEGVTGGPWRVDGEPWNQIVWSGAENRVCFMAHSNGLDDDRDIATARFIAFTRQWVPEAAAHIAALTAERDDARKEAGIQMRHLKVLADKLAPAEAERDALRERVARLEGALRKLHHAVCGETGFAACVRLESGKAYPWPALDDADEATRAALTDGGK